ncbi:MAG: hypothetical protein H7249_13195 [Chitinophagaceae bacterium]|nr:hypothetical protein [Oligoflexus sp.]
MHSTSSVIRPLKLTRKTPDLFAFHDDEYGEVLVSKRPWFTEGLPRISGRGLLLSFQGWDGDEWFDGPWGRFENGFWTDVIGPGPAFRCLFGEGHKALDFDPETYGDPFAFKQSLIEAMRRRYDPVDGALLTADPSPVLNTLNMLLFRLAFPKHTFQFQPANAMWRRLAQNLSVVPVRHIPPDSSVLPLTQDWGARDAVLKLLAWQLDLCPFIPAKLWQDMKKTQV